MAYDEITALLGGWEGFELIGMERRAADDEVPPQITLTLRAVPGSPKHCSACGAVVEAVHDTSERRVRDLPILDAETWLVLPRARVACPRCGPTVEAVPWLDRYQRMTLRFAESIARLAMQLPLKHVAAWHGVHCASTPKFPQLIDRQIPAPARVRSTGLQEYAEAPGWG